MSDFRKAYIYRIFCKDPNITDCYIGSTFDFKHRLNTHKNNCFNKNNNKQNYKVYKFIIDNGGWDNFYMDIIFTLNIKTKLELLQIERNTIKMFNAKLNTQIPLRTKKEYYKDNCIRIKKSMNQYRIDNKEKLSKQYKCICGGKYSFDTRHQHFKTQKHNKFMNLYDENLKHIRNIKKVLDL